MLDEKIPSIKINSSIPDFLRRDGPLLYQFIKYYYEWLETYENPIYISRKFKEYTDVDTTPDKFLSFLTNEFMQDIPSNVLVNKRFLLKHIKDFYRAKGSERALKLLFRILYDDDIEIYYPGEDMLRVSAGHWLVERSLTIESLKSWDTLNDLISIEGVTSGAKALVERVEQRIENNRIIYEVFVSAIEGTFLNLENLKNTEISDIGTILSDGLYTYPGRYDGTYGFLSSDKKLQDSYYYQEYSYEIRSEKTLDTYKKVVTDLTHPAGTIMFGNVLILPNIDYSFDLIIDSIDFGTVLDIALQFSVEMEVTVGEGGIEGIRTYEIELEMYVENDWVFEQINGLGKASVQLKTNIIMDYGNELVSKYGKIPIFYMGTRRILEGNGNTDFINEFTEGSIVDLYKANSTYRTKIKTISSSNAALLYDFLPEDLIDYNYTYSENEGNVFSEVTIYEHAQSFDYRMSAGIIDLDLLYNNTKFKYFKLNANQGQFLFDGKETTIGRIRSISADEAEFELSLYDVNGYVDYTIDLEHNTFTLTGNSIDLIAERQITANKNDWTYTGNATELTKEYVNYQFELTAGTQTGNYGYNRLAGSQGSINQEPIDGSILSMLTSNDHGGGGIRFETDDSELVNLLENKTVWIDGLNYNAFFSGWEYDPDGGTLGKTGSISATWTEKIDQFFTGGNTYSIEIKEIPTYLDFINGIYKVNNENVEIGDILTGTPEIDANGALIQDGDWTPEFAGVLFDYVENLFSTTGVSMVIQFKFPSGYDTVGTTVIKLEGGTKFFEFFKSWSEGSGYRWYMADSASPNINSSRSSNFDGKVTLTFINGSKLAYVINTAALHSLTTTVDNITELEKVTLGGRSGPMYIKRIDFYSALSDDDMYFGATPDSGDGP